MQTNRESEVFGNPSSLHRAGLDAELLVSDAREIIADALASSQGFVVAALSRYINYHKSFHVLSQLFLL